MPEVIILALSISRATLIPWKQSYTWEHVEKYETLYRYERIFCFGLSHELMNDIKDKGYTSKVEPLFL